MIFLSILLILSEIIRWLEFQKIFSYLRNQKTLPPPKARSSFVMKRMEERLKEALYPGTASSQAPK